MERQALVLRNREPYPKERGMSHGNLCLHLMQLQRLEEVKDHELASFIYFHVIGSVRHLKRAIANYQERVCRCRERGVTYSLPAITDLLSRPGFEALATFLEEREVEVGRLQQDVNAVLNDPASLQLAVRTSG
jgi:hypothetical protein